MTVERQALDRLLTVYPDFDLLSIDWNESPENEPLAAPWLLVTLGQRSADDSEIWARHRFAIWKTTGAIHGLQHDGSVTDDPLPL